MMLSKDATRIIGKIGLYLPLFVISLIAANAVSACPEKRTSAAYRTKAVSMRTVAYTSPTVITYRAPATYRLCGDSLYDTRRVKYVAARSNSHYNSSGARYVAVRRAPMRYVAVRNIDIDDDAPRYVAVRRAPTTRYIAVRNTRPIVAGDSRVSYVTMRNGDRYYSNGDRYYVGNQMRYIKAVDASVDVDYRAPRYVAVRNVAVDDYDEPRYVAVRRAPTRYVAVRNVDIDDDIDEPRYVSVRRSPTYVEEEGTRYISVRDESNIVADDIALRDAPMPVNHVVEYSDASYANTNGATYLTTADTDDACLHPSADRLAPEAVSTRTVSYATDDDIDDYAFLKPNRTRYVAASEFTRPESYIRVDNDDALEVADDTRYVETSDMAGTVSYVPIDNRIDDIYDDDIQYVAANDSSGRMNFIQVNDEVAEIDDDDVTYVAVANSDEPCLRRVAVRTCGDDLDTETVSYVPAESDLNYRTVSYVPAESDLNYRTVSYVPAESDLNYRTVSYVPAESDLNYRTVSYVPADNAYSEIVDDNACPLEVSSVSSEPMYASDANTTLVEVRDPDYTADYNQAARIARDYALRDGFEDGRDAALERDAYHPENSGDYQKATNGYEDDFGDKDLYKESYRAAYLSSYRQGFDSIASSEERLG